MPTMPTIQRINTTYAKDNNNPVQMNVNKIFLYRSLNKTHSSSDDDDTHSAPKKISAIALKRRNSAELERKMREKTAHIGKKSSYAHQTLAPTQGQKGWSLF